MLHYTISSAAFAAAQMLRTLERHVAVLLLPTGAACGMLHSRKVASETAKQRKIQAASRQGIPLRTCCCSPSGIVCSASH